MKKQMEPDHKLSSVLNNWDYCILSLRNKVDFKYFNDKTESPSIPTLVKHWF